MNVGNRYLVAGAALIVLSATLTVALPSLGYALLDASSAGGQEYLVAVELGVRVVENIAAPLGAALVAVGALLSHLSHASQPQTDTLPPQPD